ncbi:hypothetical protein FJ527_28280 [Mesorhizobium sp. B2-4-18]|uniref:hypothetical protein n=1 Tax=Mesorhizobium sp. B2-4-18 TaxID=2589931 RepID=UPI001128F426|nr:hypothetical protein [Mesorhizobium sp. B2-4-18]TPK70775.1 hypothetical protein FJ527_28280 [Mesorhizobium sp. B2-4-18]
MGARLSVAAYYFRTVAWSDWRGKLVIYSVVAAGVATFVVWMFVPDATNVQTFLGAAFASWISGFILFIITGLIIAMVTLARPDQELFEARARNLLQRQTGPHINYIVGKLHDLFEPYLQEATRDLMIIDYDEANNLFLVNQETGLVFGSYLADIPVTFQSQIGYINGTKAPSGRQKCCLSFLKVDGKSIGAIEEFEDEIYRPFQMQVLPQSPCTVRYRMTYWVRADDEPNRQRIKRFTRSFKVNVHNQLAARSVKILQPGDPDFNRVVQAGESVQVVNLKEIVPAQNDDGAFAFDFRLSPA